MRLGSILSQNVDNICICHVDNLTRIAGQQVGYFGHISPESKPDILIPFEQRCHC